MGQRRKPYGATARLGRNGAKVILNAVPSAAPNINLADLHPKALKAWEAYWSDPAAALLIDSDRAIVERWIGALDRYHTMNDRGDAEPVVTSAHGLVPNPAYAVAARQLAEIGRCEHQLGIGAYNRYALGIAIARVAPDEIPAETPGDGGTSGTVARSEGRTAPRAVKPRRDPRARSDDPGGRPRGDDP